MIDRLLFRITMNQYEYVGDYEILSNDYRKHQSLARSFDELGTESKQLNIKRFAYTFSIAIFGDA